MTWLDADFYQELFENWWVQYNGVTDTEWAYKYWDKYVDEKTSAYAAWNEAIRMTNHAGYNFTPNKIKLIEPSRE